MQVKIRGIKRATAKGRVYFYHRATGKRLAAEPGTHAFFLEVAALETGAGVVSAPRCKTRPEVVGTWRALSSAYQASPEFTGLAPRTRSDYGKVLAWLAAIDGMPLDDLTTGACLKIRDKAFAQ